MSALLNVVERNVHEVRVDDERLMFHVPSSSLFAADRVTGPREHHAAGPGGQRPAGARAEHEGAWPGAGEPGEVLGQHLDGHGRQGYRAAARPRLGRGEGPARAGPGTSQRLLDPERASVQVDVPALQREELAGPQAAAERDDDGRAVPLGHRVSERPDFGGRGGAAFGPVLRVALARALDLAGVGGDKAVGHRLGHAGVQQPIGLGGLGPSGVTVLRLDVRDEAAGLGQPCLPNRRRHAARRRDGCAIRSRPSPDRGVDAQGVVPCPVPPCRRASGRVGQDRGVPLAHGGGGDGRESLSADVHDADRAVRPLERQRRVYHRVEQPQVQRTGAVG